MACIFSCPLACEDFNAGCYLDLTLAGKKDLLDGCILQRPTQYLQVILIRMGKPALPPPNTKGLRIFFF